jgi:hypothetical protein
MSVAIHVGSTDMQILDIHPTEDKNRTHFQNTVVLILTTRMELSKQSKYENHHNSLECIKSVLLKMCLSVGIKVSHKETSLKKGRCLSCRILYLVKK